MKIKPKFKIGDEVFTIDSYGRVTMEVIMAKIYKPEFNPLLRDIMAATKAIEDQTWKDPFRCSCIDLSKEEVKRLEDMENDKEGELCQFPNQT